MEKNLRYTGPDGTPLLDTINKMERLYQVPLFYFEGLADEIMAKIRLENFSGNMGYQVPKDYFTGLADQILSRIHASEKTAPSHQQPDFQQLSVQKELESVAPFLLEIGNKNVYTVPAGYFSSLQPLQITQKLAETKADITTSNKTTDNSGTKVIPLTARKRIWRTAVAAAAIVVVLFSGERYFTNHHQHSVMPVSNNQFASKINSADNDSFNAAGLSELSDEEIMGYLSTPDPTHKDSLSEQAAKETQKAISSMTNEELENYLERTPATY
ncbi:hypothetical protein GCM10027566_01540 [Arachidicoccus ginsenosidivorans]|jgi:hypothetical protein